MTTAFARLIGADLPSRMLRRETAKLQTKKEQTTADHLVKQCGWRFENDQHYGPTYHDPITGITWGLDSAVRIQMVRSIQSFLQSRGWHCIGDRNRPWTYASDPIFKGEKWTKKSERSLLRALKEEGVCE